MIIPYLNLIPTHQEILNELNESFNETIRKSQFIRGSNISEFETKFAAYCGVKYCIGCGNGLDALRLILMSFNIGEGDEVIIPSNTFIATALAVTAVGAKPILVDPVLDTFNLDPKKVISHINSNTKAIIIVHLYGQINMIKEFREICIKYNLKLIEDAAQAHGSHYLGQKAGSWGDAAAFSFYPGKNLGALGDGGAVVTDNEEIAKKVLLYSNYGSSIKYQHDVKGLNSRLDEIQAGFLLIKLKKLDEYNRIRNQISEKYSNLIVNKDIITPKVEKNSYHSWHIYAIRCQQRDKLAEFLRINGIETLIHYPKPIHQQSAYFDLNTQNYPIAEILSKTELSLPIWVGMTDEEISYIACKINEFQCD